jgi:hypothetical protein
LVQAMARTPDHPAPAEHPEDLTHVGPGTERPEPKPRKGTPHERVTKTHSTATVSAVDVWLWLALSQASLRSDDNASSSSDKRTSSSRDESPSFEKTFRRW